MGLLPGNNRCSFHIAELWPYSLYIIRLQSVYVFAKTLRMAANGERTKGVRS